MHSQAVALAYHLGDLCELLGHHLGHLHLHLHVVIVFLESCHLLHVARVVGVVVVDVHRGEFVEAVHEHTLAVGVDEAQRSGDFRHPFCPAPVLDGFQQGSRHLGVVDEVEPAEAHLVTVPPLIGAAVDDGGYPANGLTVLISHKIVGLAALERRVLVPSEGGHFVSVQIRHGAVVAPIQVVVELDKLLQSLPVCYSSYLNHYSGCSVLSRCKDTKKSGK